MVIEYRHFEIYLSFGICIFEFLCKTLTQSYDERKETLRVKEGGGAISAGSRTAGRESSARRPWLDPIPLRPGQDRVQSRVQTDTTNCARRPDAAAAARGYFNVYQNADIIQAGDNKKSVCP